MIRFFINAGEQNLDLGQLFLKLQEAWIERQVSQSQVVKYLEDNCKKLNLAFHGKTPADGNCFFNAVADQLDLLELPQQSPAELRKSVVEFLHEHRSVQVTPCN